MTKKIITNSIKIAAVAGILAFAAPVMAEDTVETTDVVVIEETADQEAVTENADQEAVIAPKAVAATTANERLTSSIKTGEQFIDGHWYYFGSDGIMKTGLVNVTEMNSQCYFDENGRMQYGQRTVGGYNYYFNPATGEMSKGMTYVAEKGNTYFYDANGHMVFGEQVISGAKYYFNTSTGARATGIVNNKYYDANGKQQTGWQKANGSWYYFNQTSGNKETGAIQMAYTNYADSAEANGLFTKGSNNGRIIIPSAGINVGLNKVSASDGKAAQAYADAADSAAAMNNGYQLVVADHVNQGFTNLSKVSKGAVAYINNVKYVCTVKTTAIN